jgi:hypothetical protein
MTIGKRVQTIFKLFLRNLRGRNVGITDKRDLHRIPRDGFMWHDIHTEFHED